MACGKFWYSVNCDRCGGLIKSDAHVDVGLVTFWSEISEDESMRMIFAVKPIAAVGVDHHTPVTPEYEQRGNEFNGKIYKVRVELN